MASTNETETFQHYQVLRRADGTLHELGRGAMGVTYKAFDTNLRSYVALKVINALHLDSETARARFLREARAAAALRHRNIASVYHLGNDEQSFFYAMEFVDGQTLEALVKEQGNALQCADALQIALQVSRALGAAGKQGLVHRDIKPANIMVEREDDEEDSFVVKVIDFGLARSAAGGEGSAHITMGGFVGTPQYASPEQLEEKDLDIRSDIYSLGITLWYTLVGRPPFIGPLGSVFIQQLTKEPPWDQIAGQPDAVKALLARLLQKDPDKRHQSPTELRRDIESCLRSVPPSTGRRSVTPAAAKPVPPSTGTTASRTASSKTSGTLPTVSASEASLATAPAAPAVEPTGRPAVVTTGTLLGGRYDLGDFVGQGNNGRVFRARDLARDGFAVAVKVLHADVLKTDVERTRLTETVEKLRRAPHPHLLEVSGVEQTAGSRFLVQEWVNGFTLVDLLRNRGQLPARETLRLLAQAAGAADHARGHDLNRLELGLHQMLVHFPSVPAGSQAGRALLGTSVEDWPENFSLKLDALGITREAGDSVTWGGDMTMMPGAPVLGRDTQTSIRGLVESSQFFALGMLTYELLAGAPPAQARGDDGRGIKYAVLPSLNEDANDVLRRMLTPNPGFGSAVEFFETLCRASGVAVPHSASTTLAPPETIGGETMLLDSPVESRASPETYGGETLVQDPVSFPAETMVVARHSGGVAPPESEEEIEESDEVLAETERLENERTESARREAERIEAECQEAERVEADRREAERIETRRIEAERVEAERVETERVEAERLEAERVEAERLEAERVEAARREAERIEVERLETERVEAEHQEAARIEAERVEAERIEAARRETVRREAERIEAERVEAERLETERVEAEHREAQRAEAERRAAKRREAERLEAERQEAARIEAARLEAVRRAEAQRIAEAERIAEAQRRAEAERLAEAERVAKAERLAEAKRVAEAKRLAEAERIAGAKRTAEAEKIAEAERVAEAKRREKAERAAEAERVAEAKRRKKAEQLAEAKQLAEAQRALKIEAAVPLSAAAISDVAGTGVSSVSAKRSVSEHPSRRSRIPLVAGGLVSLVIVGGLCAVVLPRGSHNPQPMPLSTRMASKPPPVATSTPMTVAATTPAMMPAASPSADVATPGPVAASTPPPMTPEPTPAVADVAPPTPVPHVESNASMPPTSTPDLARAQHTRELAAAREQREADRQHDIEKQHVADERAEDERRDAEKQRVADERAAEHRDAEKKEAHETPHKETRSDPTPKPPKPVVAKATPKKQSSTPDPNANRTTGPGIGFLH